jgi:hypothetical protein
MSLVRGGPTASWRGHPFDRTCRGHGIEHRLAAFLNSYNFARRLKTLRGLTADEAICTAWANEPDQFRLDLLHFTSGLNTRAKGETRGF